MLLLVWDIAQTVSSHAFPALRSLYYLDFITHPTNEKSGRSKFATIYNGVKMVANRFSPPFYVYSIHLYYS